MSNRQPSLFARDDTFFGICEGLGEDLGINPLFIRLIFVFALFFNPAMTIAAYFGTGVLVLASRLIFPKPRLAEPAVESPAEPEAPAAAAMPAKAEVERELEAIAA